MAQKFVITLAKPLTTAKAEEFSDRLAKLLGVCPSSLVVLPPGVGLTVVDTDDPVPQGFGALTVSGPGAWTELVPAPDPEPTHEPKPKKGKS